MDKQIAFAPLYRVKYFIKLLLMIAQEFFVLVNQSSDVGVVSSLFFGYEFSYLLHTPLGLFSH